MIHRSIAAKTSSKRIALALAVSATLSLGSPLVAISSAAAGGAPGQRQSRRLQERQLRQASGLRLPDPDG